MSVLLCGGLSPSELSTWHQHLRNAAPEETWLTTLDGTDAAAVDVAVVAPPLPALLQGLRALPKLRLIHSLWAGVDRLLAEPDLPTGVPLLRLVDPAMNRAMAETALWAVLSLHRGYYAYARQQAQQKWQQLPQRRADELRVTVLGMGQMGATTALLLQQHGYRVAGWRLGDVASVNAAPLPNVAMHVGEAAFMPLLATSDVVINLLPLTPHTRGLLDRRAFDAMPRSAALVNLARGAHVVDDDLLAALDAGQLSHAMLDVFTTEPLPREHRYWTHPHVTVLPHVAALTDPRSAAAIVAANLRAWRAGKPVGPLVDLVRGY